MSERVSVEDLKPGKRCPMCSGTGYTETLPDMPHDECPSCGGWGRIFQTRDLIS